MRMPVPLKAFLSRMFTSMIPIPNG